MPPHLPKLGKYLEWNNGTIRVTLSVPRALQDTMGKTKLKKSLRTDSPANAERIKHGVIQELRNQITAATDQAPALSEALHWKSELETTYDQLQQDNISFLLVDRAKEIERSEGPERAQEFVDVARGKSTPILHMLETYLSETELKERSKGDARRAINVYCNWCTETSTPQTVEAASRRTVGKFVSERLIQTMERKTARKYLSFLSGYWRWMEAKGYANEIPWSGQLQRSRAAKPKRSVLLADANTVQGGKRPYTEQEVILILSAPAKKKTDRRTLDLSWIGALSGMRLDEICRLTVADCEGGWFRVNSKAGEGKTAAATRRVPIHSKLTPIINRRTSGKAANEFLIEDLPNPEDGRERSMPASKAYTRFRRNLGVDDVTPGQRQSNVDFHSWRRWFVREARDAKQSLYVIADLVGHDTSALPGGLTMGTYAGVSHDDDMRACVESVMPPSLPSA